MIQLQLSKYENIFAPKKEKWKCEYCELIMTNYEEIIKHESQCEYNPKNRNCLICDSRCDIQPAGGYGCRAWKNLKFERNKKITQLKNKIKINGIH
jgi:hypothetical protein